MNESTEALTQLIGPTGIAIVADIADEVLRERVNVGLSACATGLGALDGLDLEQYEMVDVGLPDLSVWNAAAPTVRNVLLVVHDTIEELADEFPAAALATGNPETADLESIEVETVAHNRISVDIDGIVDHAADAKVGETVATLTGMLKHELDRFGKRLRSPKVVADRWYLLGELQEFRTNCTKCLEAIAAAILTVFGGAQLHEVLPRYSTEAKRGADLRAITTDMRYDLRRIMETLEEPDTASAQKARVTIGDMLRRFSEEPAFRFMCALDKRELIVFRLAIANWTPMESTPLQFRDAVEGFDKHLELIRTMNQRPEVMRGDQQHLESAQAALEASNLDSAIAHLDCVYGRFDELDDWLRVHRVGAKPPVEVLPELVRAVLSSATFT